MHGLIRDGLEARLQRAPGEQFPPEFAAHLESCAECRGEIAGMREHSALLRALRAPEALAPPPGFYARLMERIEAQRRVSIWSVFLEPAFGRRIALASVSVVLLLGTLLALTETQVAYAPAGTPPEAVIAVQERPKPLGVDRDKDRETILVDLATFQE